MKDEAIADNMGLLKNKNKSELKQIKLEGLMEQKSADGDESMTSNAEVIPLRMMMMMGQDLNGKYSLCTILQCTNCEFLKLNTQCYNVLLCLTFDCLLWIYL